MPGYKVARKVVDAAGKTHLEYLESTRQSFGPTGFAWTKKKKARDAMHAYQLEHIGQEEDISSMSVVKVEDELQVKETVAVPAAQPSESQAISAFGRKVTSHSKEFNELMQSAHAWSEMMKKAERYTSMFSKQLSDEDQRTQDILHFIELNNLSDEEAVLVVRYLAENRRCRRQAKDALEILNILAPTLSVAQETGRVLDRMQQRKYTPKVEANMREAIHQTVADTVREESICVGHPTAVAASKEEDACVDRHTAPESAGTDKKAQSDEINRLSAESPVPVREIADQVMSRGLSSIDRRALHIYSDYAKGAKRRDLQKAYGVSKSTVARDIVRGKTLIQQQRDHAAVANGEDNHEGKIRPASAKDR